jgi:hypothetical protein
MGGGGQMKYPVSTVDGALDYVFIAQVGPDMFNAGVIAPSYHWAPSDHSHVIT